MVEASASHATPSSVVDVAAVLLSVPALICMHRLAARSLAKHWQELALQFFTVILPTLDTMLGSSACIMSCTALFILRVGPPAVRLRLMTEDEARAAMLAISQSQKR